LFVWTSASDGVKFPEAQRDDSTRTSSFTVPLADVRRSGFYFKLVDPGGGLEPDSANRFWQPSDGAEVWIKSGQVDVRSQAIFPLAVDVDFIFPPVLGTPQLHVKDLIDDFDDTLNPATLAAIDADFATARYSVSVFAGAIYNLWWSTEPQGMARRFRIPLDKASGPSIALNGYDHWLSAIPSRNGHVQLTIHPNSGSAFGATVGVAVSLGEGAAHQMVSATRQADGTWLARIDLFPDVPFWATLDGESRVDGPLDFRRGLFVSANQTVTLHTIDGVGGTSASQPTAFADVSAGLRRSLMASVYSEAVVAAGVFDPWEMPHGVSVLNGETYFVLRAPHAITCSVLLMPVENAAGQPRQVKTFPMMLTNDLRYWWVALPSGNAPHGMLYRFAYSDGREILAPDAQFGESLDPAARWAFDTGKLIVDAGTGAEQSWSRIVDQSHIRTSFDGSAWQTAGWESLLIYEMHVRRFTQRNSSGGLPVGDFDQVVRELQGGYLNRLPVTTLELLPLHEFPGAQSWGYNPSLFFAIDSDYGGPEPFARMVRAAHDAARGVVLDVVYNHMMESPLQVIARDVYVSGETAWGDMVHYAHPAACEFFRQALVYLWNVFRLDGFRFDSTETIVNGHRDDTPSAAYILARGPDGKLMVGEGRGWEFLGLLRTALRRAADAVGQKWPYLTGENDPENTGMTDPAQGVLDGQWRFQEMYALHAAACNQDDKSSDVRTGLDGAARPYQRAVSYAESHDSVSGQGGSRRVVAREHLGNGRQMAKAVGAVALLAEGIPMLFMGEEAGEDRPFLFDMLATDPAFVLRLDDYEQQGNEFFRILTWFRNLMGLRNNPSNGLQGDDRQTTSQGRKTLSFTRSRGRFFIAVTFGTPDQRQDLGWLGLPFGAAYKEIFNSSWPEYQVNGEPLVGNGGFDAQLNSGDLIRLPSIGAVILERR
jgi:1,4-alpha-glucan branching enzyme